MRYFPDDDTFFTGVFAVLIEITTAGIGACTCACDDGSSGCSSRDFNF